MLKYTFFLNSFGLFTVCYVCLCYIYIIIIKVQQMIVNHIETGEKLPENILIVIRLLDKEVRDSIIRRYWKAGKESSNNSVILGYHNVQDCHLNMIRAVLKVALPIAKEYVKTMNDTNFIIESEILANQPQTA